MEAMLCERMVDYIRDFESAAVNVQVHPECGVIFKLPDKGGLMVPWPLWAEYCKRARPVKIYGVW